MKVLITGAGGFVGSTIARELRGAYPDWQISGLDNFSRPGSELHRRALHDIDVRVQHADLRNPSDLETVPAFEWVIDAAANPSVLAGVDGKSSSRQVVENNLYGTVNLLELCRARGSGLILLSTSRVYSIATLSDLPMKSAGDAFQLDHQQRLPPQVTAAGIAENFSTAPPLSLYGNTKLASENLALEYQASFGVPVWINRCGVLAGAGQFGRIDQGIYAFWVNSYLRRQPLRYLGFGGSGRQVRDALHPRDLVELLVRQMSESGNAHPRIVNLSGGRENSLSLAQLSAWCAARFGAHEIASDPEMRRFDVPWLVLDSAQAAAAWDWRPQTPLAAILDEIARHAETHPEWLEISGAAA